MNDTARASVAAWKNAQVTNRRMARLSWRRRHPWLSVASDLATLFLWR
jgi:hypothetical protein